MLIHQLDFPSIGSFCFNEIDVHFPNETDQLEFESIKRKHTDTMVEMLSERNLNERGPNLIKNSNTGSVLNKLWLRVNDLKNSLSTPHYDELLNPILDLIDNSIDFNDLLRDYYLSDLPTKDHLKFGIKKGEEMRKLDDLIRNLDVSNENQKMVFDNLKIDEIYKKSIVKPYNFTLHKRSKLIFDFRSTSTLHYDVVLPFHDKNYDPTDCTRAEDLPWFFKYGY